MSCFTLSSVEPDDYYIQLINDLEKMKALSKVMGNANLSPLSESTTFYFASVMEEIIDRSIQMLEKLIEKTTH